MNTQYTKGCIFNHIMGCLFLGAFMSENLMVQGKKGKALAFYL